jgi:hypothetical protein
MRMSKAVIVLAISLTLAVPAFASPSDDNAPGRNPGSLIMRVLKQIKRIIVGADEPSIPVPH